MMKIQTNQVSAGENISTLGSDFNHEIEVLIISQQLTNVHDG